MSSDASKNRRPTPEGVLASWWTPFGDHLAHERRCSPYTVRNYRAAFEDFYRWLASSGLWGGGIDALGTREIRDFVIEAQRRYGRRTLHNHVSGLRALCRFWMTKGRLRRNPFTGAPLPKLQKRLPQFLTEDQARVLLLSPQRLLEAGGCDRFTAWRDRLAMELLYGAGLRVSELVGLSHGAVEIGEGVARVTGKGRKQRICPLGNVACAVLVKFRDEFAPNAGPSDPVSYTHLYRTCEGTRLVPAAKRRPRGSFPDEAEQPDEEKGAEDREDELADDAEGDDPEQPEADAAEE